MTTAHTSVYNYPKEAICMTAYEKEKIEELERDVKIMQKELKETFADFEKKKTPADRVKGFFDRIRELFKK